MYTSSSRSESRLRLNALRTLFIAIAAVSAAPAQVQPPLTCSMNGGVIPTVRAENLSELVGDVIIACSGDVTTPSGGSIPRVNIQIYLNTNVTSRLLSDTLAEALLLIDEPPPAAQFP